MASSPRFFSCNDTKSVPEVLSFCNPSSITSTGSFSIRAPLTIDSDDSDFDSNSHNKGEYSENSGSYRWNGSDSDGFVSGDDIVADLDEETVEEVHDFSKFEISRPFVSNLDENYSESHIIDDDEGKAIVDETSHAVENHTLQMVMPIAHLSMDDEFDELLDNEGILSGFEDYEVENVIKICDASIELSDSSNAAEIFGSNNFVEVRDRDFVNEESLSELDDDEVQNVVRSHNREFSEEIDLLIPTHNEHDSSNAVEILPSQTVVKVNEGGLNNEGILSELDENKVTKIDSLICTETEQDSSNIAAIGVLDTEGIFGELEDIEAENIVKICSVEFKKEIYSLYSIQTEHHSSNIAEDADACFQNSVDVPEDISQQEIGDNLLEVKECEALEGTKHEKSYDALTSDIEIIVSDGKDIGTAFIRPVDFEIDEISLVLKPRNITSQELSTCENLNSEAEFTDSSNSCIEQETDENSHITSQESSRFWIKDGDFMNVGNDDITLSSLKRRGDKAILANLEAQFYMGRNSEISVRAGLNNKQRSGQIKVKVNLCEPLQIVVFGIISFSVSIFRSVFSRPKAG